MNLYKVVFTRRPEIYEEWFYAIAESYDVAADKAIVKVEEVFKQGCSKEDAKQAIVRIEEICSSDRLAV